MQCRTKVKEKRMHAEKGEILRRDEAREWDLRVNRTKELVDRGNREA